MAFLTANDYPVGEGWLMVPRQGRALAEILIASAGKQKPIPEGAAVTLRFQDGTSYAMSCRWAGLDRGLWKVRLVAGKGKLSGMVRPKFYRGIPIKTVITDLLAEIGETPGTIQLSGAFERYVRRGEAGHQALATVLQKFPGHVWRFNRSGGVDVVSEAWPTGPEIKILEEYHHEKRVVCRPVPGLLPGVVVSVGRVDRVKHNIGPALTTEVFYV